MINSYLPLAFLASAAFAGPIDERGFFASSKGSRSTNQSSSVVHEQRHVVPEGFFVSGTPQADEVIPFRIALTPKNISGLEDRLYDVSTPGSANYGKHLSLDEVEEYVRPSNETTAQVTAWLSSHGLNATTLSSAGDWLGVNISVSQANAIFATEFQYFTHNATGVQHVRTMNYSIPDILQGHLDLVHPTITFPDIHYGPIMTAPLSPSPSINNSTGNLTTRAVPSSCNNIITPACLESLYGIPSTLATQKSNTLAVTGYIQQYANQADLKNFLKSLRPDLNPSTPFTLQTIDGGSNPQGTSQAGVEANLDIQYTVGVASGVPTTFISVGNNFQDGALNGFLDTVNLLLGEKNQPQVITTSYGQNENTISRALAQKLCNAYMQLGARGTTILFASGDGGVSGSQSGSCSAFVPTFPSGCPYLTSVGATTGISPETATTFSSGGFSNYFNIPSYQSAAVSGYLAALGTTNKGKYNASGRGYPDISAQGENVEIAYEGKYGTVAGTSCSSPIIASVISLVNDRLIAAGKSPMGFLNPFLYSSTGSAALNDVTSGSNPGCNTNGFPARAGWDPVTGLGTPNFPKLLKAVGLSS